MNDTNNTTDHDQTDEETLTYEVSDEALEASAGTDGGRCGGTNSWICDCLSFSD